MSDRSLLGYTKTIFVLYLLHSKVKSGFRFRFRLRLNYDSRREFVIELCRKDLSLNKNKKHAAIYAKSKV